MEQVDRDAAAGIATKAGYQLGWLSDFLQGRCDDHDFVQAFARHRLASATQPSAREEVERLTVERDKARRAATDRDYMIEALVQMLGPNGREVWKRWQERRLVRVHVSWGLAAAAMSGEEIAEQHLKMDEAAKNAVPIDDVDAMLPASPDA